MRGGELKRVALGLLRPKQKAALDLFAPQRPPGKATPAADAAVPRVVWVEKNPDSGDVLEYFGMFLDFITAATMYGYWHVRLFIAFEQCL